MLRDMAHSYSQKHCPVARTLDLIGERWTVLILRDLFLHGPRRYQDLQESLAVDRLLGALVLSLGLIAVRIPCCLQVLEHLHNPRVCGYKVRRWVVS